MQSVIVTGVSTGIGWGVTKVLIQKGFRVYGSLRKQEDAERLSEEFGENFIPLIFDVTDEDAIHAAAQQVRVALNGETLFGLVNNAGIASPAPLLYQPIQEFRQQIEINLIGQLTVTQAFAPFLGADRSLKGAPGRIINIGSVSGRNGSPFLGAYSASKHALEGMSESLRRELMLYGIDVIMVAPGPIATPIWDKAEQMDTHLYQQTEYHEAGIKFRKYAIAHGRNGLSVEHVGKVVYQALTRVKPRVRYTVLPHPFLSWSMSILPKRFLDHIFAKNLGFVK